MYEKFSSQHFVEFLKAFAAKQSPYWFGTTVVKCTEDVLKRKTAQYPSHYTSSRMAKYKTAIANKKVSADCIGLLKGYAWADGGTGVIEAIGTDATFTSKYASNGCPDTTANGMFNYAKNQGMEWGTISTMPEIPGIALRMSGHVGYYIGDGKVVEERGFNYGCVITKLNERPWTHWYKIPFINYNLALPEDTIKIPDGERDINKIIKRGASGEIVKELQMDLIKLGYSCGSYGADGDFGRDTESAVKAFQQDYDLEIDGKVGPKTWEAIDRAMREMDVVAPVTKEKVTVTKGSWNVRNAPSFESKVRGYAHGGDEFEVINKLDGWYEIRFNNDVAFISAKAIKI